MQGLLRQSLLSLALAAGSLALGQAARADVVVTNVGVGPSSNVSPFGSSSFGNPTTFGEVLTVPAGNNRIDSITFYAQNTGTLSIPFAAYVYAFNGTTITGSALTTSTMGNIGPGATFVPVTAFLNDISLISGNQYYVFFSTIGQAANSSTALFQTQTNPTSYPLGDYRYSYSSSFAGLPPALVAANPSIDLTFTANFLTSTATAVPEPGPMALAGVSGLFGLAGLAFRRFRGKKTA